MGLGLRRWALPPLAVVCLLWTLSPTHGQAPPLPANVAPDALTAPLAGPGLGKPIVKFGFLVFDQLSYKEHPFKTLTGDEQFGQNVAANGSTGLFGSPDTDREEDFFNRALHTLPPFRLDYSWALDFKFPKGIGIGVDYAKFSQLDTDAFIGTLDISGIGFRLTMDTYLLTVPVRFYGFDPRQPGINFFVGFSLGFLNGNLLAEDATGSGTDQLISFSQSPVGMTRMGIEVMGESFGGRFELTMLNASDVEFDSNPFPGGGGVTTVDMSGTILQLTIMWVIDN